MGYDVFLEILRKVSVVEGQRHTFVLAADHLYDLFDHVLCDIAAKI